MDIIQRGAQWLHVRFEGRSYDLPLAELDIGDLSPDQDVRQALAVYFNVPVRRFQAYVIERHANGNMTVRPEATFG